MCDDWFHHLTYRHLPMSALDYLLKTLDFLDKEPEGTMANHLRNNLRTYQRSMKPGSGSKRSLCLASKPEVRHVDTDLSPSTLSQSGASGAAPQDMSLDSAPTPRTTAVVKEESSDEDIPVEVIEESRFPGTVSQNDMEFDVKNVPMVAELNIA